jgi:hypothetical protein
MSRSIRDHNRPPPYRRTLADLIVQAGDGNERALNELYAVLTHRNVNLLPDGMRLNLDRAWNALRNVRNDLAEAKAHQSIEPVPPLDGEQPDDNEIAELVDALRVMHGKEPLGTAQTHAIDLGLASAVTDWPDDDDLRDAAFHQAFSDTFGALPDDELIQMYQLGGGVPQP